MSVQDIDEAAAAVTGELIRKEPHFATHSAREHQGFSPRGSAGIKNFSLFWKF
jgi:hypothetical protein